MDTEVAREFARLRKKGWAAREALVAARTNVEFEACEDAGFVRFRIEPDDICEVDWDFVDKRDEKESKARIEKHGMWGIISEARNPLGGEWEHIDSVWGFVGDDVRDNGYDTDVKQAALDWLASFEVAS